MLFEQYLQNNPAVRWSLILFLVLILLLEGLLIADKTGQDFAFVRRSEIDSPAIQPTASAESLALSCTVINPVGLRVREQPAAGDNIIKIWPVKTAFLALGRNGEAPWLLVQVDEQLGWVSAKGENGQTNIECEDDLFALPSGSLELAVIQLQPTAEVESGPKATPTARARAFRSPTASATATATQTQTATPTASATKVPAPTWTPTPNVRLRSGNGPNFHVVRRKFDINLDGQLNEWGNIGVLRVNNYLSQPENYVGAQDLSGVVRAVWDEQHLYLAVQVTDDHIIQEGQGAQLHNGDAIELFWDSNLEGDFGVNQYNGDDVQIAFAPGGIIGKLDSLYYVYHSRNGNNGDGIEVWSWRTGRGYDLEIRIPWSVLGTRPQNGAIFGYAIALSDDDTPGSAEQESQLATTINSPEQQPTRWSNFILEP